MANEIWHSYDSAKSLYAFVYRMSDMYIYDVGDAAFEAIGTWNDARAGECDIVMTATGDSHSANFPNVAKAVYYVQIREKAGANPDTDDTPLAQGVMYWDGSAEINLSTITINVEDDLADIQEGIDTANTNISLLVINRTLHIIGVKPPPIAEIVL